MSRILLWDHETWRAVALTLVAVLFILACLAVLEREDKRMRDRFATRPTEGGE